MTLPPDPERKRNVQAEHIFQRFLGDFAEKAIALPPGDYEIEGFDTAGKSTRFARARAGSRGIKTGQLDHLLSVIGLPDIWMELKYGRNESSDNQDKKIAKYRHLGRTADVAWTFEDIVRIWRGAGVPLVGNVDFLAMTYQGKVETGVARQLAKVGRPYKARVSKEPRFTAPKRMARKIFGG